MRNGSLWSNVVFGERSIFPRIWFWDVRIRFWGLEIKPLKPHNYVGQGRFFFHYYLATWTTNWAQIFTGLLLYAYVEIHQVRRINGLWQLPIVSSVFWISSPLFKALHGSFQDLHLIFCINIFPFVKFVLLANPYWCKLLFPQLCSDFQGTFKDSLVWIYIFVTNCFIYFNGCLFFVVHRSLLYSHQAKFQILFLFLCLVVVFLMLDRGVTMQRF